MLEHRLDKGPPVGRRICLRCGWAEWDEPEPCRRPRVEPGMQFGRLSVVALAGVQTVGKGARKHKGSRIWRCVCSCDKIKLVPTHLLTRGETRSCGCLRREMKHNPAKGKFGSQYDRRQRRWGSRKQEQERKHTSAAKTAGTRSAK